MINKNADSYIKALEKTIKTPIKATPTEKLLVGLDLGTAFIVLVVLGEDKRPLCCKMEFANVVRDGLVVDFSGATKIVTRLKAEAEAEIGREITTTSLAVPPGTDKNNQKPFVYVAHGAGMEILEISDEPTAANQVLQIADGAVVDIGGGTTGLSIFKDGEVVYTADEPTGGTHVSLVLAGNKKIDFDSAEKMKRVASKQKELFPIITPVFEKMGSIIKKHISGHDVKEIYLVGGTACMAHIEDIISAEVGLPVVKPKNPLLVTPLGIALSGAKES